MALSVFRHSSQLGLLGAWLAMSSASLPTAIGQTREEKVRDDRAKVESEGFWIYNDWARARLEAESTGRPIIVVLRCIPCEECVKLDDHLVDEDPILRPLLEKFVRVRLVSTNGLDLNLFQYDFDQSFAVFLLNADGTIYGRFGTRSHRTEWVGDVSIEGLAEALKGAISLHANYPANRAQLVAKRGEPLEYPSPEKYPLLKDKYTSQLATSGEIVKSCIHCHQIGDAQRDLYRVSGEGFPEKLLFPYPHPTTVGLTLDPHFRAKVEAVAAGSAAQAAGLAAGDVITHLSGQPILSTADVQWVLHHASDRGEAVSCKVQRGNQWIDLTMNLPQGWRRQGDLSWRVSSWGMRRMTLGGMVLDELTSDERREAGIESGMALRVRSVGQYGPHATAKKAGFAKEDILVEYNGRNDLLRETDLLAYSLENVPVNTTINVKLLRKGQPKTLKLLMQP